MDSADGVSAINTKKSRQAARATDKSVDKDTESSVNSKPIEDKSDMAENDSDVPFMKTNAAPEGVSASRWTAIVGHLREILGNESVIDDTTLTTK